MTRLTLRPVLPPFDLNDGVGELVQVSVERVQEVQERVPAGTSMAVLDLRNVRGADIDAVCELLLRKPGPITQCTQSVTKGHVVTGGGVGGLDDLATFTDRLGCGSLDRPYKWRPR
jgi:hypothetical protein